MAERVNIFIPYPEIDPIERQLVKEAAQPGYQREPPLAVRDIDYANDLRTVTTVLESINIRPERPTPVTSGEKRGFRMTVELVKGVTMYNIRTILNGFDVQPA